MSNQASPSAAIAGIINTINTKLSHGVRWLTLFMVLVTGIVVIMRYAFDTGSIALQESVTYMHGLVLLLGIPYGIMTNTHVRVDVFYSRMPAHRQRWVDIGGHVLFLLPIAGFIFYESLPYVVASWQVLEGSPEVGGLPIVFLLKSLLPVMAALLFLQGISELLRLLFEDKAR